MSPSNRAFVQLALLGLLCRYALASGETSMKTRALIEADGKVSTATVLVSDGATDELPEAQNRDIMVGQDARAVASAAPVHDASPAKLQAAPQAAMVRQEGDPSMQGKTALMRREFATERAKEAQDTSVFADADGETEGLIGGLRKQMLISSANETLFAPLVGGLGNQMIIFETTVESANRYGLRAAFLKSEVQSLHAAFDLSATPFHYLPDNTSVQSWSNFNPQDHAKQNKELVSKIIGFKSAGYMLDAEIFLDLTQSHRPKEFWKFSEDSTRQATQLLNSSEHWVAVHYRHFPDSHYQISRDAVPTVVALRHAISQAVQCKCNENPGQSCPEYCVMVFSNDYNWAMDSLNGSAPCLKVAVNDIQPDNDWNGQNTTANNYGRDLAAMAMASRLVTTAGTFGMFARLLHTGEGPVYQPSGQPKFETSVSAEMAFTDNDPNWCLYSRVDGSLYNRSRAETLTRDFSHDGLGESLLHSFHYYA